MRLTHLLLALLVSANVALGISLIQAPYSTAGRERLIEQISRLESSLVSVRERHDELLAQVELLTDDRATLRSSAQDLQYYRPGDQVVRINGEQDRASRLSPGSVVTQPQTDTPDRRNVTTLSIGAGLLALLLLIFLDGGRRHGQE